MHRALVAMNVVLLASLVALWTFDASLEKRREARRAADSAFHLLLDADTPSAASVARIELLLPGSTTKWPYVRRGDSWRLPEHRDGYALGQQLEGLLKSLVESHGTIVGRVTADAEHFGIVRGKMLEAQLYDTAGKLLAHALAGSVAPGQRSSECFLAAEGREPILQMDSNPWPYVEWSPGGRFPPLLDTKVIPTALRRGLPSRIAFEAASPLAVRDLIRREAPKDPRMPFGQDRGPRYEWFGTMADGEKRLNDNAAFGYTGFLASLVFDELLGPKTGREPLFERPSLTVTIEYDGGAKDALLLGAPGPAGASHLLHTTTGQVFLISADKARGLTPDVKALLEPPPAPPPQPVQPQLPLPAPK